MEVIYHLQRAIDITREHDQRKWPDLIAELPDAAQEPCRRWLEHEAKTQLPAATKEAMREVRAARRCVTA